MVPTAPGTYALVLRCRSARRIAIGRSGALSLRPGYYVYVGSAFGPGGLGSRVAHHQHRAQRPHWHIDYLRKFARLEAVWYTVAERCEHAWAARVSELSEAVAIPRFGNSDCTCPTHLFHFDNCPDLASGLGTADCVRE